MGLKARFSLSSLMLLAVIVALLFAVGGLLQQVWKHQRDQRQAAVTIDSLEQARAEMQQRAEREFVGAHAQPVLLLDPRLGTQPPWLFRINNSKYHGSGGKHSIGPPGPTAAKLRTLDFELRLLRSLDQIDYYLFVHTTDGRPSQQVLLAYDGKVKPVIESDTLTAILGPDVKSCVDAAVQRRDPAERPALQDAWTSGAQRSMLRDANLRTR